MIYFVSCESELCSEKRNLYSNTGKWVLSRKRYNFQIQDMFEKEKPDIVLKTVKRFNIIRTPVIIFISKKFRIGNWCPRHV